MAVRPHTRDARGSTAKHIVTATIVAAVVRLAYVLAYPQIEPPCPDCGMYDRAAVNLAAGRGLVYDGEEAERSGVAGPVITFGPVYPVFLAAIYRTEGHHVAAVRVVQALVGSLIVPMMWPLAMSAFGAAVARITAWLVALSPPLIVYSGMLLTESLSTVLLVCTLWLAFVAATHRSRRVWAAAGCAGGLLILIRPEMLLVVAGLAIVALWKARSGVRPGDCVACVLALAVCVGAWAIRNYVVFSRPVLTTAKAGEQLWQTAKGWTEWRFDDPEYQRLVRGHDLFERDSILRRDAIRLIADAPGRYLAASLERVPELWISSHTSYVHGLPDSFRSYAARAEYTRVGAKLALLGTQVALLALAGAGAAIAWRTAGGLSFSGWLIALPIIVITLVHFFLFATPRYQVPALPSILAFAAVAIARALGPPESMDRAT